MSRYPLILACLHESWGHEREKRKWKKEKLIGALPLLFHWHASHYGQEIVATLPMQLWWWCFAIGGSRMLCYSEVASPHTSQPSCLTHPFQSLIFFCFKFNFLSFNCFRLIKLNLFYKIKHQMRVIVFPQHHKILISRQQNKNCQVQKKKFQCERINFLFKKNLREQKRELNLSMKVQFYPLCLQEKWLNSCLVFKFNPYF